MTSGDKDNVEASAAAYYFPALFGEGYTRRNEDTRNAALNYAYAILRGYMARCLTVYGFQPCLGLHHDSELNQFNLADDLMEPFRPVADLYVAANVAEDAALTPILKGKLVNLLNADILFRRAAPQRCLCNGTLGAGLRTSPRCYPNCLKHKQHSYASKFMRMIVFFLTCLCRQRLKGGMRRRSGIFC